MYAESNAIYEEVNEQIEKWSKIVYLIIAEFSPICMIVPKGILCLFLYSDSGADALELPIQELSVQFQMLHQFSIKFNCKNICILFILKITVRLEKSTWIYTGRLPTIRYDQMLFHLRVQYNIVWHRTILVFCSFVKRHEI